MTLSIKANNLSKTYGHFEILKSINLEIPQKTIYGIIGTSGAGKTTLLKILSTLENPSNGELEILGQKIPYTDNKKLRHFRQNISVIFQNYHLLNALDVFENVALPLRIKGIDNSTIHEEVTRLLELVGLNHKSHMHPAHLSGGQKQRVAIARALISKPKILLCDEPTAALDPENTHSVLNLLREIKEKLDTTIILVTHEIGLIGGICDQIAIVHDGKVAEAGKVDDIFFCPKEECTKKLISPKKVKAEDFFETAQLSMHRLFQLKFIGQSAKSPLISEMVSKYNIKPNILAGNIDKIGTTSLGQLVVSFDKNSPLLEDALEFLKKQNVLVEEL